MPDPNITAAVLLAVMPEGIGDLTFASNEWVEAAETALKADVSKYKLSLEDLPGFTICEVAFNPPAYLHCGPTLAWNATFKGASVEVNVGELPASACDYKVQCDHSIISNLARIQYHGNDPVLVASAQNRLSKLCRWKIEGKMTGHHGLGGVLRSLHDTLAVRTMPRFVFMTPEWVSTARYILSTRAAIEKYAGALKDVDYTFAEEFTNTPGFAFPDGSHGGFWVSCRRGRITVGAGPLPQEFEPADMLTKGEYTPVVPVGRTVVAAMTEDEQAQQASYSRAAFRYDKVAKRATIEKSSPSGNGDMPAALARIFMPLHDELSKRTSGELPLDFDSTLKPEWSSPPDFDRNSTYDPSWLRYDKVDIYGNSRS